MTCLRLPGKPVAEQRKLKSNNKRFSSCINCKRVERHVGQDAGVESKDLSR